MDCLTIHPFQVTLAEVIKTIVFISVIKRQYILADHYDLIIHTSNEDFMAHSKFIVLIHHITLSFEPGTVFQINYSLV